MADQNETDPKAYCPVSMINRHGAARGQRKRQTCARGCGGRSAKVSVQGTAHQLAKCCTVVDYAADTPPSNRMRPTPAVRGLPSSSTEPLQLPYMTVEETTRGQEEDELKSAVHSRQTNSTTRHYGDKSRQTTQHGSPVRGDAVCTTPGKCQAGGELRLSHFSGTNFELPDGFAVVGAKSPMLQGMTLVALVDKRYLPDEKTNMAMLGFSGNCLGCGAKGFRYFTEFSTHINLRLATQPKKQKHLKYFIIRERSGRLRKGPQIPWRVDGRKRTYPLSGPYVPPAYSNPDTDVPNNCALSNTSPAPSKVSVYPAYVQPTVSQGSGSSETSSNVNNRNFSCRTSLHSTDGRPAVEQHQPYQQQNSTKRARWESCSSEAATSASSEEPANDEATSYSATRVSDSTDLPTRPWLTMACSVCPVLLLCQHSIPKIPCLVDDIIISDLLVGCFDPPLVSDQTHLSSLCGTLAGACSAETFAQSPFFRTAPCLTSQMAILLIVQYLSQLVEDDRLSREDIESLLQDAKLELSATMQQHSHLVAQSNMVSYLQLPVLANLTAATSKGRVKVVASPVSLDCAIVRTLKFVLEIHKHNQTKYPRVPIPDFIFVLATPQQKAPEFCILVTSISQAKYLSEAMLGHPVRSRISENLGKLDQIFRLSSDALEQLVSSFEEALGQGQLVFIPFNGFARMKVLAGEALSIEPKVSGNLYSARSAGLIFSAQHLMAKQLVTQVCTIAENSNALNVNQFVRVDLAIVVPPVVTLFNQTVKRLHQSGLLTDLGLEGRVGSIQRASQFVIMFDETENTQEKLRLLRDRVQSQPKSLFVLIFDQAQFYSSPKGLDLPYFQDFLDATNVLPVFVTAVPYLFQTNQSFIDPENEVYWTENKNETEYSNARDKNSSPFQEQEGMYFGIKEYCDSIKWTHQFPLIRQDDAFERMTLRTIRATEDLDLSVLRCYLLTRHYCAAIMWSAGIKPAEPHCTLKTIQIMREIIESPVRNADGSGSMLVIRIPSVELANFTLDSLRSTRDRLGFQFRFALVHDSGSKELDVEDYFLKRLRLWRVRKGQLQGKPPETWCPSCFEELQDLPCIVLLSGRERTGETFPRSLKYIDLRLIDRGFLYRSSLELEFSAIACYIGTGPGAGVKGSICDVGDLPTADCGIADTESAKEESPGGGGTVCKTSHYSSNYPLPVILVSQSAFKAFQTDFYGYPKHLLLTTTPQTRWVSLGRAHLVTSNPGQQSLYYREWTEPKPKLLVGTQCNSVNSRTVISMRSASGIVISPEIPDVVEEDGLSAVESLAESNRQASGGPTSEAEDSANEDTKPATADGPRGALEREQERRPRNGLGGKQAGSLAYRLDRVANGQLRADSDPGTTDDESDSDRLGKRKYHPRSILFSGPPQVGKTGTCLHFVRLLNRMLLKLQRVDVYDISSLAPETNCTPSKRLRVDPASSMWPDYNVVSKLPFSHDTREHKYANISSVISDPKAAIEAQADRKLVRTCAGASPSNNSTRSVMLSSWSSYDIYHHCDSCKQYREGVGPSASLCYAFKLRSGEVLQFVIPPSCQRNFAFTQDKQLRSLRLPLVLSGGSGECVKSLKKESGEEMEDEIKTPIMMPSTGRHETGLLNLYHALYGAKHVHLVFVKHREVALYHKTWPNHVIVGLPASCDCEGLGVARFFIKEFATDNLIAERERQKVSGKHGDVWPFVFMMDDSCVMWQNLLQESMKSGDTKEKDPAPSVYTSLLKVLQHLEATPDLMKYGLLGVRQYSSTCTSPIYKGAFSHCTLNTAFLMNVSLLQDIQYDRMKYSCEDVDFSLRVQSRGVLSCRFNNLAVVKKHIETGGSTTYRLQMNGVRDGADVVVSSNFQKLVTAPDREDSPFFSVPAHYLLELYLARASANWLFSTAADAPSCPVLLVDCYVNLGPRITVEFVSTRDPKCATLGERQGRKYGGLLLYLTDSFLTAELLHQYQFVPGARLCLVSQDRNTLRQEVARLDLEERWRFRLRDEFQTANDPDEASLYFLTGTYE